MTESTSTDPTPKLKSSPIPINFVSFYKKDNNCFHCGNKYIWTGLFGQRYCRNCFLRYVHDINYNDNNCIYLDAYTYNWHTEREGHIIMERNVIQNLNKEWHISYFNQIPTNIKIYNFNRKEYSENFDRKKYSEILNTLDHKKYCNLCGKLTSYQPKYWEDPTTKKFSVCSDCYLISSERIESLNKHPISVVYLPWWYGFDTCLICNLTLNFISNCQKWCTSCQIIFVGCRYCLTTNIIFGLSDQSQCRKCKRKMTISISISTTSISGNSDIDEILHSTKFNSDSIHKVNHMNSSSPMDVYEFIKENYTNVYPESIIKWIPYCQITILEKIAEGGFGIVYKAIWLNGVNEIVVVKRLKNSQRISRSFLNELRSHHKCHKRYQVLRCYGVTKDPSTGEYMFVMPFAKKGTLHHNLQSNFQNMNWKRKIEILTEISHGLETIHNANFTHRDFHSKNILFGIDFSQQYQIGDLGLSQPADSPLNNHEIYGIVPYIAPEIFKNNVVSPKSSDVFSLGMIMWECTTGLQPFADVEHSGKLICDITNGRRPEITKDTPECFANLMRRCWDNDPTKRPSIAEICNYFFFWNFFKKNDEQFNLAEKKRLELMQLKMLGPEFAEEPHPKAIYTSRPLRSLISECSSMIAYTNLTSTLLISSNTNIEYISLERELDISSRPKLSDVKTSRKRNIEELNIESDIKTQDDEKRTKIDEILDEIEI